MVHGTKDTDSRQNGRRRWLTEGRTSVFEGTDGRWFSSERNHNQNQWRLCELVCCVLDCFVTLQLWSFSSVPIASKSNGREKANLFPFVSMHAQLLPILGDLRPLKARIHLTLTPCTTE